MNARLLLGALALFVACAKLGTAQPPKDKATEPDKDPVKEKLFAAKVAYDKEMQQVRKQVTEWLDKREETARKDGNKKQVDQIKTERAAFDETGELPKTAPATMRQKPVTAKKTIEAAYAQAIKDYVKAKKDAEAAAVEEELKEFKANTHDIGESDAKTVVIVCTISGKVYGLQNGATDDGTKVVTADYVKGDQTQVWKLVPAADGWVLIENAKTGLVVTVNGKNNGAEAIISKKQQPASENQLWKVTPVPNMKDTVKLFAKPSGKIIGVDARSKQAGFRIILWDDQPNQASQMFSFTAPK